MRSRWLADTAPAVLGGMAEAGWLSVYAAAAEAASRDGGDGRMAALVPLIVAAMVGVAAGRLVPFGPKRRMIIFLLVLLAMGAGVALALATGSDAHDLVQSFA